MAYAKNRRHMSIVRHRRLRKKVRGSQGQPRLAVFRSSKHIYAQLIDDAAGRTLAAVSSLDADLAKELSGKNPIETAKVAGNAIAKRAAKAGVGKIVFDRGGFKYHGRVRALAEAAREAGLEF